MNLLPIGEGQDYRIDWYKCDDYPEKFDIHRDIICLSGIRLNENTHSKAIYR